MLKATACGKTSEFEQNSPRGRAVLDHGQRHLRRCRIDLENGERLLVDLPETVALEQDDVLILEGGGHIAILAAHEPLYEVTGRDGTHLSEICWHIGNRHLAAEILADRILILKDHVIKGMLEGLGGRVKEIIAPFSPIRGAYSGHAPHGHDVPQTTPPFREFHFDPESKHGR